MKDDKKHPRITNPHDSLFRDLMDHPKVYREFFLEHLPAEVLALVSLATVTPSPRHFVNERFKNLHSDCLFEAEIDGKPGLLYVLVEHQSSLDRFMPFRLLQYMVAIWDSWLKEREYKADGLPLIYPVVVYSGRQTHDKPTGIQDLIRGPRALVDQILFRPFPLLNLRDIDDDRLLERLHLGLLFMTLKHAFDKIMPYEKILAQIPRLNDERDVFYFLQRLLRYILEIREDVVPEDLRRGVAKVVSRDAAEAVMTAAELLREEGRKEGKKEAIERVALNFLKAGFDEKVIASNTGLSLGEIHVLMRKLD